MTVQGTEYSNSANENNKNKQNNNNNNNNNISVFFFIKDAIFLWQRDLDVTFLMDTVGGAGNVR